MYPRMSKGYLQPLVIIIFIFFIFGVTFVHANLCMQMLVSNFQDGGDSNPFPVIFIYGILVRLLDFRLYSFQVVKRRD